MSLEQMKTMKEQLMSCVQSQMTDLSNVDAHEMGEAIDMIKDLAEAIYYCTITDSMEKADKKEETAPVNNINYYTVPYNNRTIERNNGYMYYPTSTGLEYNGVVDSSGMFGNSYPVKNTYKEDQSDIMNDPRYGRSPMRRRMYMEGKERNNDTNSQLRELETYLQELSQDITEMIKDASPEEKATLRQKMTTLASKIS